MKHYTGHSLSTLRISMLNFAANLSFLFQEYPFLERFEHAARHGFKGVEYLFPYEWSADTLREKLNAHGLQQVLFNLPAGDWAAGERGMACHPGREGEFSEGLVLALSYAKALGCTRLHVMSGLALEGASEAAMWQTYVRNVRMAAERCAQQGVTLLIEPINSVLDMPGYWLDSVDKALALMDEIAHPAVRLQLDLYHVAMMGLDVLQTLERCFTRVGHIQVADKPGRHEPGTGELPWDSLFARLQALKYSAWIGCEYRPLALASGGLDWILPWQVEAG